MHIWAPVSASHSQELVLSFLIAYFQLQDASPYLEKNPNVCKLKDGSLIWRTKHLAAVRPFGISHTTRNDCDDSIDTDQ